MTNDIKPTTHQADLTKLPRALTPLIERPQWAIWRHTQLPNGKWQKPPFMATQPDHHVSTKDPHTWCDYKTALAAVQAGHGDGVSYVLTEEDPFAVIDIDHCRDLATHSIDKFAQLHMQFAVTSYQESSPSGEGVHIWGLANGPPEHRNIRWVTDDGKETGVELYRRTRKVMTITGSQLSSGRELTNIDKVFPWSIIASERRKAAAAPAPSVNGHHVNGNGSGHSIDEIEQIVREGAPAGGNRSNLFHTVVGHYVGCGWDVERILAHLQQFPDGIGARYHHEDRLLQEITRSAGKFKAAELPSSDAVWTNGFEAKAPQPEPEVQDRDIDEDPYDDRIQDPDDGLDDDNDDVDPDLDDKEPRPRSDLPPMYCYGDPDARPIKSWLIKRLMASVGHGILGGQWGTYKTFIAFDLAACLMTGQPFLGYPIKRQCGVLFIAAEGADEVRLRVQAVVNTKCGNMPRAPFCWYETAPTLLHKDSVDRLVAMGEQAAMAFQKEFGLSLGLVIIDTMAVAAGYSEQGAENDSAIVTAVMKVLKDTAERLSCFVLGVDHYGKNMDAGLNGSARKETQGDLILACLGERERSGRVNNTRLAVRKCRGGVQGLEFPFTTRVVEHPEKDEDGEVVTTLVIDWQPVPPGGVQPQPVSDPWAQSRRQDQRTAVLRLKRILMSVLADQGVELAIPPDGPIVRMVDQEIVREQFYVHTPADGTSEQKGHSRRQRFLRALDWAKDKQLIGVEEIDGISYLRLTCPDPENDDEEEPD